MKEKINLTDYAQLITEALPRGILLCTQNEKFNVMVIGWGGLGICWSVPVFTVYVRDSRWTKAALDQTGEFVISVPLGAIDPEINRVCGALSGRNVDKVQEAHLTLEEPDVIGTSGIKEYPLTLECKVLYAQKQDLAALPKEIVQRFYPQDAGVAHAGANRDPHTAYIGQVVSAYIIK